MTTDLTDDQRAFLTAAVDTLIPADDLSSSGSDCGVVDFLARQLAGPWGDGAHLYRHGPLLKGKPEHGYQLGLTPRELIFTGISAADVWTQTTYGKPFAALVEPERIAALKAFESGTAEFPDVPARDFFETLLAVTMEGFFCDPVHGGNRDCASWTMIGYPGQPANYRKAVTQGTRFPEGAPRSITDFS